MMLSDKQLSPGEKRKKKKKFEAILGFIFYTVVIFISSSALYCFLHMGFLYSDTSGASYPQDILLQTLSAMTMCQIVSCREIYICIISIFHGNAPAG